MNDVTVKIRIVYVDGTMDIFQYSRGYYSYSDGMLSFDDTELKVARTVPMVNVRYVEVFYDE